MLKLTENELKEMEITDPFDFNNSNNPHHLYYTQNTFYPDEAITHQSYIKPKKQFKKIYKKFKGNLVLPHPTIVQDLILYKKTIQDKKDGSYIKTSKAINVAIGLSSFLSSTFTTHDKNGDLAISNKYINKSLTAYRSYFKFYAIYLERTHKGNNIDGHGCSSYNLLNNPYDDEKTVYSKKETIEKTLNDVIKGSMSIDEYKDFYQKKKISNTYTKKELMVKSLMDETVVYTKNEHEIDENENYSSIIKIKLNEPKWSIEQRLYNYLYSIPEEAITLRKRTQRDIKKLLRQINDKHIYVKRTFTTVGREYDFLNQMPKGLRAVLFEDYIEMDLRNAAYNLILNKLEKEGYDLNNYKNIVMYAKNRDSIINEIMENYSKGKTYSKSSLIDTRKLLKTKFLSFIFGSTNSLYMKYTNQEQMLYWTIKETKFYEELQKELNSLDSLMQELGFKQISDLFMEEETKVMDSVKAFLSTRGVNVNGIISIHDGILVPKKDILKLSEEDTYILNSHLKENHQFIEFKETRQYIRVMKVIEELEEYTNFGFTYRSLKNNSKSALEEIVTFYKDLYNGNDEKVKYMYDIKPFKFPKPIKTISKSFGYSSVAEQHGLNRFNKYYISLQLLNEFVGLYQSNREITKPIQLIHIE